MTTPRHAMRAGGKIKPGDVFVGVGGERMVAVTIADYQRLLECAESDRYIDWCQVCRAWLDIGEEARANVEDFSGCWKAATGNPRYDHLCRSYRALEVPAPHDSHKEGGR